MAVKNAHAVALGALGASLGGLARARALSPARRLQIARKASKAAAKARTARAALQHK